MIQSTEEYTGRILHIPKGRCIGKRQAVKLDVIGRHRRHCHHRHHRRRQADIVKSSSSSRRRRQIQLT